MRKRRNATAVGMWLGMTAAALMLGACSQSEEQLETLPEGKFPLELTAAGLQPVESPMTRATVDGNWDGVEKVAVKVGGEVKEYDVDNTTNGNTSVMLKSADPFYWKSTAPVTVSAWWPCSADVEVKPAVEVKTDQSAIADYQVSDYIEAEEQEVTYTAPTLTFKHRTAKVCVNVVNDGGQPMAVDAVTLCLDGKADGIKPYKSADGKYAALIAPTTQAEGKLSVKIVIDGATYVYTHPTAYTLAANMQYTFTLTVKRDGIQLNGCTISPWDTSAAEVTGEAKKPGYEIVSGVWHIYNADGLKAWATQVSSVTSDKHPNAILENDIEMPNPAEGETSNWEPVVEYKGIFDGNNHTINNLVINGDIDGDYTGFISGLSYGGKVMNLTLKNASVNVNGTQKHVGALLGRNSGDVVNCHVTGSMVKGQKSVGGLVGNNSGSIQFCDVLDSEITVERSFVGGICGYSDGELLGCYAVCKLTAVNYIGGLIGYGRSDKYRACYSKCEFNKIASSSSDDPALGGIAANYESATYDVIENTWWYPAAGVSQGIGGSSRQPDGIKKIDNNWDDVAADMNANETLSSAGYEYITTGDDKCPLKLVKRQE